MSRQSFLADIERNDILNAFTDPIMIVNRSFRVVLANSAVSAYLSLTEEELLEKDIETFVTGLHREDPQWNEVVESQQGMVREALLEAGRRRIEVMITISPFMRKNECIGYILLFRDMRSVKQLLESLKSAYRKMSGLVITDQMSQLYNRGHFNQRVKDYYDSVNHGQMESFTFVIFDIDHFKDINDNLGHQVGDTVIIEISDQAKKYFGQYGGEVFRYGGEEFVMMSQQINSEEAFAVADKFRHIIEKETPFPQNINVTISLGVVTYTQENKAELTSVDVLIRRADDALYNSKESGRNQVTVVKLSGENQEDFDLELF